jgi:hypothetical protein
MRENVTMKGKAILDGKERGKAWVLVEVEEGINFHMLFNPAKYVHHRCQYLYYV